MLHQIIAVEPSFNSMAFELILCNTFAHRARTTHTTCDHLQQIICIIRSRPLLMGNYIDAILHFRLLDQFAISAHALLSICLAEGIRHECCLVQTCKRNELPAIA